MKAAERCTLSNPFSNRTYYKAPLDWPFKYFLPWLSLTDLTNSFSFLRVCSVSPRHSLRLHTWQTGMWACRGSRETCGYKRTADCITSDDSLIWLSASGPDQEVWWCERRAGRSGHTMAPCPSRCLVLWEGPGWWPLCWYCCCCWPLWHTQVRNMDSLCLFCVLPALSKLVLLIDSKFRMLLHKL